MIVNKNREREAPIFANINLLGKCNANCYFCLGKDIEELLSKHDQRTTHFSEWSNFERFLNLCRDKGINHLYLTGQNIDSLQYRFFGQLRDYLQRQGFLFGIRTNGILAPDKLKSINKLNNTVGYSVHTLNDEVNKQIMGVPCPDWDYIIPNSGDNVRVAIVVNRYNFEEFFDIVQYLSKFPNIKYIQARRISTDTRMELLEPDMNLYEMLYWHVTQKFMKMGELYGAQLYNIYGMEVVFWRTVETSVNSFNYFTDGTISDEYFIIEGYLKYYKDNCVTPKKENMQQKPIP